jgi:DNA polymerase-4
VRSEPTILHVELDAFYATVEQRDKPWLRGRPVVVGGVGGRGVVATASYEARAFGVRSAMSTREARSRAPHAAYLSGRHAVYRAVSDIVMARLRELSPLVEPLSLDEAFVDLAAGDLADTRMATLVGFARDLKADVEQLTGGVTGSVGIGTSKLVAKIASDLNKPDGLVVVPAGTEPMILHPLPVTAIPGIGPATAERLRRVGVTHVRDLVEISRDELVRLLGQAVGAGIHRLARADDDRPVVAEREAKSISVEDTYDTDLVDRRLLEGLLERQTRKVAERLRRARLSGRTVTVKVRAHDFTTHTRSTTLAVPTDDPVLLVRRARTLLGEFDTSDGVRLLGVGVSGLADWIQDELFTDLDLEAAPEAGPDAGPDEAADLEPPPDPRRPARTWNPGMDVEHEVHGPGWVWGAGVGRVTVRFETATTGPGPVRTFAEDDPALQRRDPPAPEVTPPSR